MACYTDPGVVRAAACNPSVSIATLTRLADDFYPVIREAVAKNPKTPLAVLDKLIEDKDQGVAFHARENLQSRGAL